MEDQEFGSREEAIEFIIRNQFGRRNLSAGDRSILAHKLEPILAEKAKRNLVTSTGGKEPRPFPNLGKAETHTDKELAKIAGVSHGTIYKVGKIIKGGTPEQLERIKKGGMNLPRKKKETSTSNDLQELETMIQLVPADRRAIAEKLATEIAFMHRTLERLRQEVDKGAVVDLFKQGKQEFLRENPSLKAYTNLIPKYSALYKQVTDLLPAASLNETGSELEQFIK